MAADHDAELYRIREGRFSRLESIEWWNRETVMNARILVIGAGALGNEVIKNLALLGIGHLVVVDMDRIEMSNLSRSVLFRESDCGANKADCAIRSARSLHPDIDVAAVNGNVLSEVGLGFFRNAQVVIGALDNREARVFVNSACARVQRPWIDGGIEVFNGIVRVFAPPGSSCYECTMSESDWRLLNERRSCSLLARRSIENRGTPTTPTTASIIGAMQAQEALKLLHGIESLEGRGFVYEGLKHSSYQVEYPIDPDCRWHEPAVAVVAQPEFDSNTPLRAVSEWAAGELGGLDALDLSREIIVDLSCPSCKATRTVLRQPEHLREDELICEKCQTECVPGGLHSIGPDSELIDCTAGEIDLPKGDIIWARFGEAAIGIEFSGDQIVPGKMEK